MRKFIFVYIIISLISIAVPADDLVFAEGLKGTNYEASVAQAVKFRTIVYVWEHVSGSHDIKLLVVRYNRKGKFSARKVIKISGSHSSRHPSVVYNEESRKFLVTWTVEKKDGDSKIFGLVLNARGKLVGQAFPIFNEKDISISSATSVPLLQQNHIGTRRGDFLVSAFKDTSVPLISLKEFDSRTGKLFPHNTKRWPALIPIKMLAAEAGQVFIVGTLPDPGREIGLATFQLNDAKAKYYKIADIYGNLMNLQLTELSPQLLVANWADIDRIQRFYNYRMIRSSGKPRGRVKDNKAEFNFGTGNYVMAANGKLYNVSRAIPGPELVINIHNSKGKYIAHKVILDSGDVNSMDLMILEIKEFRKLLIIYKTYRSNNIMIKGHFHLLED